ncbi:MAG: NADH-quinone oxidoreductase subunit H [candidate division NC10 bacterium]|nr:NADH-quinone oxidoreductase subunit H [candidate division NC10 bacterium]
MNLDWKLAILNVAVALLLSPLLEGVIRKVKARIHSRMGPPLIQPYLDLLKLLGKEDIKVTDNFFVGISPLVALAAVLVASLLIPLGGVVPLGGSGDMIAFIYFIGLAAVAVIIGGLASESPFALVGASREMMIFLIVEPVLFIGLITAAVNSHSLRMYDMLLWHQAAGPKISMVIASIALFLALQAQLAKLPFDIPEAETELMGGPFIEMSGPKYALFRWSILAKQIVFTAIFVQIFIPWPKTFLLGWDLLITLVKIFVVILLVCLVDVVNPRLRIDQAIVYFFGVIIIALAGLAFAMVGA